MMSVHTVQVLHHKFTVGGPALNSYAGGRGLNTQKLVQDSNLFINLQASMINIQIGSDPWILKPQGHDKALLHPGDLPYA